jgi:hypothetical protein
MTDAKAFNDSPLLALLFFGGGQKSSTSPRHLSSAIVFSLLMAMEIPATFSAMGRFVDEREPRQPRFEMLCSLLTGSREENAMRTDGIGATQPVGVKLSAPWQAAEFLIAACFYRRKVGVTVNLIV